MSAQVTVACRRLLIYRDKQEACDTAGRMCAESDLMPSAWYQQLHTRYVRTSAVNSIRAWQQKSAACWEHISVFMCVKTETVCGSLFKMMTNRSREERVIFGLYIHIYLDRMIYSNLLQSVLQCYNWDIIIVFTNKINTFLKAFFELSLSYAE